MKSCFAVIDEELVWHGGMNLLGKADYYDNLMRFESKDTTAELLEKNKLEINALVTNKDVADALGCEYTPLKEVIWCYLVKYKY